jgi:Fe-S oxidoreductase
LPARGKVYLFCDEFTNFNDVPVGIATIRLLTKLGLEVTIPDHLESGRTYLSKGMLKKSKALAIENIKLLKDLVSDENPLIGIEPSAILSFRDEYPNFAIGTNLEEASNALSENALLIDEFLDQLFEKGEIDKVFSQISKADQAPRALPSKINSLDCTHKKNAFLSKQFKVETIPSGCCGMAGSFGYEKEHYEISMQIGELELFPAIRNQSEEVIIAAPGTSCRHQIKDGTGRMAKHPVEILWEAIEDN